MSILTALALGILCLLVVWLAWRYVRLRRALHEYSSLLRAEAGRAVPSAAELGEISRSVGEVVADLSAQLSRAGSERDRLAAVLEQMTDGVLIANSLGVIEFANPAARRLFQTAQPLGHTVTEVVRHHRLIETWQRSRETRELQSESVEIPARREFLQLVVMPDAHGGGSLLLVQDLTRLRRLETVRQDFVSNFSHELRTPLASLRSLAETLLGGAVADPHAGPRFLERMITEVDALTQLSTELLDLSRIESGQVQFEFRPCGAREILDSAADRMRMQAERAQLVLRVDCPAGLPTVFADRPRIEQVLVNLIHNSIKFTRPGGQITLAARSGPHGHAPAADDRRREGNLIFSVEDTGVGMPAEALYRIFERFYQLDASRSGSGTGLGLSICKHIVESHGGTIWAESTEGSGSTFFFTIPSVT